MHVKNASQGILSVLEKAKAGKTLNFNDMRRLEYCAAAITGKGWSEDTIDDELKCVQALLGQTPVGLCIDIGGNKGDYTAALLERYPLASVVMFEPSGFNCTQLRERFDGQTSVRIEQKAVAARPGTATLYSDTEGSVLGSLSKRDLGHIGLEFSREETVETVSFEDFWRTELGEAKIDLCKIDVEGHELDVLSGFGDALAATRLIQFEFGGCNIDTRTFFKDFWQFFQASGFDLFRICPFGARLIQEYRELDETFSTTNYLARRRGG